MNNNRIVLTTQDIVNKDFTIESKGFKPQEVDAFLDIIIKDYVSFDKELKRLKKELNSLSEENSHLRSEIRKLRELETIANEDAADSKPVNNVDLLRRISQLEKIVYGRSE
ncbi:MAG: DivIVA domain-containing protein [bacterium]|nr:DivIVA domain-containing protein [bacterium]